MYINTFFNNKKSWIIYPIYSAERFWKLYDNWNRTNKPPSVWFHLSEICRIDKSLKTEDGSVVVRSWEKKMDGGMINGWRILMLKWRRCLRRRYINQKKCFESTNHHWTVYFKYVQYVSAPHTHYVNTYALHTGIIQTTNDPTHCTVFSVFESRKSQNS